MLINRVKGRGHKAGTHLHVDLSACIASSQVKYTETNQTSVYSKWWYMEYSNLENDFFKYDLYR